MASAAQWASQPLQFNGLVAVRELLVLILCHTMSSCPPLPIIFLSSALSGIPVLCYLSSSGPLHLLQPVAILFSVSLFVFHYSWSFCPLLPVVFLSSPVPLTSMYVF